jgi:hypothetical protein
VAEAVQPAYPEPVPITDAPRLPQGIKNPLWQTVKGYLLYAILAGYLYTVFALVTVHYSSREDRETESGYVKFSGINMLLGSLPRIHDDRNNIDLNQEIEYNATGAEKKLARTPLIFRTGYLMLTAGIVFYMLTVFMFSTEKKRYLNSIARVICFFSSFAVLWVFNDFEKWQQRFSQMGSYSSRDGFVINIESNYSIGFWLVFLSFLLLTADYAADTIKHIIQKNRHVTVKKIPNT